MPFILWLAVRCVLSALRRQGFGYLILYVCNAAGQTEANRDEALPVVAELMSG